MNMDRRRFLELMGHGALVIGASSLVIGCGRGIQRQDLLQIEPISRPLRGLDPVDVEILHYASLAPSSHNAQPWYVKVLGEREWLVGVEPKRRFPVVDSQNRETLLSMGAFLEHISIAAGALGYEAEIAVIADSPLEEDIARVSLKKSHPSKYPLERITTRRTVREGLRPTELKRMDIEALSEPLDGHIFYFSQESEHGKCIQKITAEAVYTQTYRDDAQREFADWFRISDEDAGKHRDGMTLEASEITGFVGWYMRNFMDREDVTGWLFCRGRIDVASRQTEEGAGWFIITSAGNSVPDLIETGRRFERMFLLARERNVAVHAMSQALEEEKHREEIASEHDTDLLPQLILRVGYIDNYPDPVSLRRPVDWFVRT
jgi:hypothetical protein